MSFKKFLPLVFLAILLSPIFVQHLTMAQSEGSYCPADALPQHCHKVIIIGAGMAGLGAAIELKSNHLLSVDDFVILEKENRTGGRVNTSTLNNVPIDLHASWISGTYGNPTYELAQKYNGTGYASAGNIILKKTDDKSEKNFFNSTSDAGVALWNNFTDYYNTTRNMRMQNNLPDVSLQVVMDQFIANKTLSDRQKKDFLFEAGSFLGVEYGSDPSGLSLFYFDKIGYIIKDPKTGAKSDEVVLPHGYDSIIKGLVADVGTDKILHNTSVQEIDYNNEGVVVKTNNGNFYGKYVISTLPLNVLKTNSVKFVPDLPEKKIQTIQRSQMGILDKTYFLFPTLFWSKDDNYDWLAYVPPLDENGQWINFLNLHKATGQNLLLAFNYGNYANNTLEKLPGGDQDIKMTGLKILDRMYPGKGLLSPSFVDQTQIHHGYDGREGGSYSSNPVGFVIPDDYDELVKPLTDNYGVNRLFFAGEATTWHAPGLTNGAYETGIREANRLIMTDSGKLYDPPSPAWQEKNLRYPIQIHQNQTWYEFPEYVICRPDLMVVLESNDLSPRCVTADTANDLFKRHIILDPKVDPNNPS